MELTLKEIEAATGIKAATLRKRAGREGWQYSLEPGRGRGGRVKKYDAAGLPEDVRAFLSETGPYLPALAAPAVGTAAAPTARGGRGPSPLTPFQEASAPALAESWGRDGAKIGPAAIEDTAAMRRARIVREASSVPAGWKRREWIESVALRNETSYQTIYKWMKKHDAQGLAGLRHTKPSKGQATAWDEEALQYWVGLCLKREHRKMTKKALYYRALIVEAHRQGWRIGSESSAIAWARKLITPQLKAFQRGGPRALDNALPPVIRNYADLNPFDIIVGDQHRLDFWAMDEETGEAYRREGYFWQDLRTRLWYGAALSPGRHYDSQTAGLALHIGCRMWGAFKSTYNDNGKPEKAKFLMRVIRDIRALGLEAERVLDGEVILDDDPDLVRPAIKIGRRWAVVRNAKAKMIEGSFSKLKQVMIDMGVPGYVKKLGGSPEENDIDQAEADRLARAGKLLTGREMALAMYQALDFMNRQQHHRGVWQEWPSRPRPRKTTPLDCLQACYEAGWRPTMINQEDLDIVFLLRAYPTVRTGRITFDHELYEHDKLIGLEGQKVELRYDPHDTSELLVFHQGEFLCIAEPAEQSSMIDADLSARLIAQKRRRKREFILEYRRLTAGIQNLQAYSLVPVTEKAEYLTGRDRRKKAAERSETFRVRSDAEMAAGVAMIEDYRPQPARPTFRDAAERYQWCLMEMAEGRGLGPDDQSFMAEFEESLSPETQEYWRICRESLGLALAAEGGA